MSWRYIVLGTIRVGGGALRGNEDRVLRKMPHVSIEENQKGPQFMQGNPKRKGERKLLRT